MPTSTKIEKPTNPPDVIIPEKMAIPKMLIKWRASSILLCAIVCTSTIGLLACIIAIAAGAAAPLQFPFMSVYSYTFYRMAMACLLTALFTAFIFIFSIDWVNI
ncbi:MAG: hypothetical protein LBI34_00180 [Puniceicoccales bacterium]|nr:hypothetical protein [Puniceicoccales bacterium]